MQTTMEKLEKSQVKLTIQVDAESFDQAMTKAARVVSKRLNVPGFRKGKAPRRIIENFFGEAVFYEEAIHNVFNDTYQKAVDELQLDTMDMPEVDVVQIESGKDMIYEATVTVRPEVKLGAYKGIVAKHVPYTVSNEDVDHAIDHERDHLARWVDVDRAVQNGDRVLIDYQGKVDGVAFEGGEDTNASLEIGSNQFIPGFEEQLIGMKRDEERTIHVTFPEAYHSEDLSGKEATFDVLLHDIKEKQLADIDDEFAKDVSDFDTLAEYKASVREKLEAQAKQNALAEEEKQLVDSVLNASEVFVPDVMIEHEIDGLVRQLEMRLAQSGLNGKDFLRYTNQTVEQVRDQYREEAERRAKFELVRNAIVAAEGMTTDATDEDNVIAMFKHDDQTIEEVRATLSEGQMKAVRADALTQKMISLLRENAIFSNAAEGSDSPTATEKE